MTDINFIRNLSNISNNINLNPVVKNKEFDDDNVLL